MKTHDGKFVYPGTLTTTPYQNNMHCWITLDDDLQINSEGHVDRTNPCLAVWEFTAWSPNANVEW